MSMKGKMRINMKRQRKAMLSWLLAAALFMEPVAAPITVYAREAGTDPSLTAAENAPGSGTVDSGRENYLAQTVSGNEGGGETEPEKPDGGDIQEDGGNQTEEDDGKKEQGGDNPGQEDTDKEQDQEETEDKKEPEDADENDGQDETASEEEGTKEDSLDIEEADAESEKEAPEEETEKITPVSEEEIEAWAKKTGHVPNGYQDIDYDVESLTAPVAASDNSFAAANCAVFTPVKYDAREKGQLSSVKNQANWGCCWSFSAVAAAESAYLKLNGTEADLSESHLVNFFYNGNAGIDLEGPDGGLSGDSTEALADTPVQQGGNSFFTTFALARWTGIADEATDASLVYPVEATANTNDLSISGEYAYTDAMHLENAYWIPLSDATSVKQAIMDYGAVGVSYYYSQYFDSDLYKYVEPDYDGPAVYYNPAYASTNHAVAIVGWDDTFDRNQFRYTYTNASKAASGEEMVLPENNGAWLIRNSWGSSVLDGGYFWISYEDLSLNNGTAFAFDFAKADNYDHNYQYDGSTGMQSLGSTSGEMKAAAVYTASGRQTVSAVGIGFASASTDYTVQIYTGLSNKNNPTSGTLAATTSGRTSFEGFYTIEIEDFVLVEEGELFSVVITAKKENGQTIKLFVDSSYPNGDWISFTANTEQDNTFLSTGNAWVSAGEAQNCTMRIKAYTNDYTIPVEVDNRELRLDMLEDIMPQEYTGEEIEPELHLVFDGERLIKNRDYTATFQNNKEVSAANKKASVTIRGIGNYVGEITAEFTITKKVLRADMISVQGWVYDGTTHQNIVTVTNQGTPMTEGTDYTIKYNKSPLHAGTYTVTVTGKGTNYSGSAKQSFTIEKRDLTDGMVSISMQQTEYTGKDIKPAVSVRCGETTIPAANYTIKYSNNKTPGTASVTITGKTDCQGTVVKGFEIARKTLSSENITVKSGSVYTGGEVKPGITVKVGGTVLKANRDYQITGYADNIDATTDGAAAKVFLEGIGNYDGKVTKEFAIKPRSVAANKIKATLNYGYGEMKSVCVVSVDGKTISASDYTLSIQKAGTQEAIPSETLQDSLQLGSKYDITVTLRANYANANQKPAVMKNVECKKSAGSLIVTFDTGWEAASYEYKGSAYKPAVVVKDGETVLKKNKDYAISYKNNTNAGEAAVVITGKGNYNGTKELTFTIRKKVADTLVVTVPDKTYTGAEIKSPVTVKAGQKKLKAGTDYTYTYANNTDVSYVNGTVDKQARVIVTLLNYTDNSQNTEITGFFQINPARITSVKVGGCYYLGENIPVEPAVTVKAGKLVLDDTEYDAYYDGHKTLNNKAKVTVTAKGNYQGSKTVNFKIAKEPLSKAEVTGITDRVYAGVPIEFSGFTVKSNSQVIIPADQYNVTYKNNQKAGTASVTIKAKADSIYSGSITKKFKITKAELGNMVTIDQTKLASKTYTGQKQTYKNAEIEKAVTAKVDGDSLKYKVGYENNTNAGTAVMILTGTGNYTGKVRIEFPIQPRSIEEVNMTLKQEQMTYAGDGIPVFAEIKKAVYGKLNLKRGKDYTLSYMNNKNRGLASIKVTGTGNYTGTKTVDYRIL
ncbi:MAG: lectin like domain-containing protein [Blautia sp.]|nr:lectin like domain-containing protein [Lachnoclostridium sp.]MCM1210611.1 lectin like domain-containing protein [Blautia sp.]